MLKSKKLKASTVSKSCRLVHGDTLLLDTKIRNPLLAELSQWTSNHGVGAGLFKKGAKN
jgi:hypothetical protein